MIVVDTSTWADYFNGTDTPHVGRLEKALADEEDLALVPIVLTEVLQGFKSDRGFAAARRVLVSLPILRLDIEGHVRAASLFRLLRAEGITVRGAVDCVIAQTCLDAEAALLSPDTGFQHIARHTSLRLWRP